MAFDCEQLADLGLTIAVARTAIPPPSAPGAKTRRERLRVRYEIRRFRAENVRNRVYGFRH